MTSEHTDVGAYALGLLEPEDRRAFEDHLAGCPACSAELAELSGMKDLLTGIEPVDSAAGEPSEAEIVDLVHRRALAQRRRSRWRWTLAAAASVALLGGGVAAGLAAAPHHTQQVPLTHVVGAVHSATGPTGVRGEVGLVAKAWGTQVTFDLSKVRGPLECQLIAVSRTGERRVVTNWIVPRAGYGVPGHPAHLFIQGGTAIPLKNLSRLVVTVVNHGPLVTIPV